jgi:hypothetical protein
MSRFIIIHDETVELAFKYFNLGLSHGLGSLMGHSKYCPNILNHMQTIYTVEFFFVN